MFQHRSVQPMALLFASTISLSVYTSMQLYWRITADQMGW